MSVERIVNVYGVGLAYLLEENANYARVRFDVDGHRWETYVEPDEYTLVEQFTIGEEVVE